MYWLLNMPGVNVDAIETMPYDVAMAEMPVEPVPPSPSPDSPKDPVLRKRTLRLGEAESDDDQPQNPQPTEVLQPPPSSLTPAAAEPGSESGDGGEILDDPVPSPNHDAEPCPPQVDGNQDSKQVNGVDLKPKSGDEQSSQGFNALDFQDIIYSYILYGFTRTIS